MVHEMILPPDLPWPRKLLALIFCFGTMWAIAAGARAFMEALPEAGKAAVAALMVIGMIGLWKWGHAIERRKGWPVSRFPWREYLAFAQALAIIAVAPFLAPVARWRLYRDRPFLIRAGKVAEAVAVTLLLWGVFVLMPIGALVMSLHS